MGTLPWQKPPAHPWTAAQRDRLRHEREAYLRSRTEERSDDSVAAAVAQLQELTQSCRGMIVALVWERNGDGTPQVDINPQADANGQWKAAAPEDAKLFRLSANGLEYVGPDVWGMKPSPGKWLTVPTDAYPTIVRYFQLFEDDLEEILKHLQMD